MGTLFCQVPGRADSNTRLLMTPMIAMIAVARHNVAVRRTARLVPGRSTTQRRKSVRATSGTTHVPDESYRGGYG